MSKFVLLTLFHLTLKVAFSDIKIVNLQFLSYSNVSFPGNEPALKPFYFSPLKNCRQTICNSDSNIVVFLIIV